MADTAKAPEASESADYEDRVLVYLDVLGWKELITASVESNEARTVLAKISSTLGVVSKAMEISIEKGDDFFGLRASQFSDLLVMSSPTTNPGQVGSILVMAVGAAQVVVKHGHYVRGAIVRGKLVHRPDVIYGPALVEAYKIERDVAKYPRIIVAPAALEAIQKARPVGRPLICDDRDGLQFLDIFTPHLYSAEECRTTRARVSERLNKDRDNLDLLAKHSWMLSYLGEAESRNVEGVQKWLRKDLKRGR